MVGPGIDFIQPTKARMRTITSRHGILLYCLAFSLGLATSESMLYVCSLSKTPPDAMRLAISRLVFSLPMHAACGCLTGLGLIRRHLGSGMSLYHVLLPAVLLHGFFDFALILVKLIPELGLLNQDWVEPIRYGISLLMLMYSMSLLRARLNVFFHNGDNA